MTREYSTIEVTPQANQFAAEVRGITLSSELSAEQVEDLKQAWYQYSILYFPDQPLNHTQLESFTQRIGGFGNDPFIQPLADHPHILELERKPDETVANFGAAWHSDWSFQLCPPSATILHAKVIPPIGGDTLFSDNYRAYESLSPAFRDMINGLKATHSAAFAYSPKGVLAKQEKSKTRTMKILYSEEADKIQLHPLVRTHPGSGRKAIYVNPVYTTGIEGMSKEESFVILSFLFQLLAKEEFIYRHHWQENVLLMWDNRCCNHLAEGGYDGHRRLMHRTTVLGEEPKHS